MGVQDYTFRLSTAEGVFVSNLDNFLTATISRTKNDIGEVVIVLPDTYGDNPWGCDFILDIYKRLPNGGQTLVGGTCWFLRVWQFDLQDSGECFWTLTFVDTMDLLRRRHVLWFGQDNGPYPSNLQLESDNLAKAIFWFNLGDGADGNALFPDGSIPAPVPAIPPIVDAAYDAYYPGGGPGIDISQRISGIQMDVIQNAGPVIQARFEFENVLEVLQNIANQSEANGQQLWFDITCSVNPTDDVRVLVFRTWIGQRGQDTGQIFSPELRNLSNATLTYDFNPETTLVIAGGAGNNELRALGFGVNPVHKPFYPIEGFINSDDDIDQNTLSGLAQQQVGAGIIQGQVSGTIVDTEGTQFFVDYNFGDVGTLEFRGLSSRAEIPEFNITLDASGETIQAPIVTI